MIIARWLPATVSRVVPAARDARIVELEVPDWPGNLPGQHLDLRLTAEDGYEAVRSYSIASSGSGTLVELGIDEVADGEVSPYLVHDVAPGDEVEVKGPLGAYFVWDAADSRPVQLIAGGSGIVPLLAMARARARSASSAPFRLLYSVRSPADEMYRDEVAGLEGVDVAHAYTREAPPGWTEPVGRLTPAVLVERTFPPSAGATTFVCGPTRFVEAVADALVASGHDAASVRTERFGGS